MYITNISIDGYRNLKNISVIPHENVNIIVGDNAQGKTNFIEALWILSGCRSFRGSREREFIDFDGSFAKISVSFKNSYREQNICFQYDKTDNFKKLMQLNGIRLKSTYDLYENYSCIAFTPDSLDIVKGSPAIRRSFIDMCISQIKPKYIRYINKAENILIQRNAVIRHINEKKSKKDELEYWNYSLAHVSSYITAMRALYIKEIREYTSKLLEYITDSNDKVDIEYISTIYDANEDNIFDNYFEILNNSTETDLKYGYTTVGIHRDDISILLDGKKAKNVASQGQARSIAIALKLAQTEIISRQNENSPILFLDDVFSELDDKRQAKIMEFAQGMQIFLTCCDKKIAAPENSKIFVMKKGELHEI